MEPISGEQLSPTKINRRDFLKRGAAGLAAGCQLVRSTNTTTASVESSSTQLSVIDEGSLPAEYSPYLKKFDLQPRVLPSDLEPEKRLSEAISYLIRYSEANRLPILAPLKLRDYNIDTPENYPIQLPEEFGVNIKDVVRQLIDDYLNGTVRLVYKTDYEGFAGTMSFPRCVEQEWQYSHSEIWFGPFINQALDIQENENLKYTQMTDTELATILIHEYGHVLQGKKISQMLNDLPSEEYMEILDDDYAGWLKCEEIRQRENERVKASKGITTKLHTNEAQANALMEFFLHDLNTLNDNEHIPGTVYVDPTPIQITTHNWENIYTPFKNTVLKSPDGTLDREWLLEAGI